MKESRVLIITVVSILLLAACASQAADREDLREKMMLGYQYLEEMDFDMALDTFAAVIEVDEKQTDAYIGMARAYSAKGNQKEAGNSAARGYEATGNKELEDLGSMYERISDHEDQLRKAAELLEDSGKHVSGELEEGESHLFSDLLENLWKDLDSKDTWLVYDGMDYVIVYPTDPEKGEYLLIYPDGHFYLGEVDFAAYSDILAMREAEGADGEAAETEQGEESLSRLLTLPEPEGQGVLAGIGGTGILAEFYTGLWKDGLAEGEGIYVFQKLPEGERYVYYGTFVQGLYDHVSALYGSSELFLRRATGEEVTEEELFSEFGEGIYALTDPERRMTAAFHAEPSYTGIFANMDRFRLMDLVGGIPENADQQLNVIAAGYDEWQKESNPYAFMAAYYAVTDLDHDGLLEIVSTAVGGSGSFSYFTVHEMKESLDGLNMVFSNETDDNDDMTHPDLMLSGRFRTFFREGTYVYITENTGRVGAGYYFGYKAGMTISETGIGFTPAGSYESRPGDGGGMQYTYYDENGNTISEDAYKQLEEGIYSGWDEWVSEWLWIQHLTDDGSLEEHLRESLDGWKIS